ncbi:MAG: glycine cleavage system protein GcvH [Ignavibacteriaceae bacterium]|nr:glycine cleavage system protein GcvH [Ignavibacteriaceae bacterium]NUM70135.1 glycine cleavage system protein GcvH [Ignavibacteriaceae bacterium]
MNTPENLLYTNDHEWILVEGNTGTIGITDFAQSQLGDIVFVDIDPSLSEVTSGGNFGTIEAVKTISELYSPCSGKVVAVNEALSSGAEVINSDPYGEGWLIKIELTNSDELKELLTPAAYKELTGE